jgi:hypothetical protein
MLGKKLSVGEEIERFLVRIVRGGTLHSLGGASAPQNFFFLFSFLAFMLAKLSMILPTPKNF